MDFTFKFKIDQKVKTVFGDNGLVDMAAVDNSGDECYYVKLAAGKDSWFKVAHLEGIE